MREMVIRIKMWGKEKCQKHRGTWFGKHPGVWAVILTVALILELFGTMTYATDRAQIREMTRQSDVSQQESFLESTEFQQILDGYLQILKLYMRIRSTASTSEEVFSRPLENLPFLEACDGGTNDMNLEETAKLEGHNFDYERYLQNYLGNFSMYCEDQVGIDEVVQNVFSLQDAFFALDTEKGGLYTLARNSQRIGAWKTLKKQAKKVAASQRYVGQEMLLPSLDAGDDTQQSTMELSVKNVSLQIPLQTTYSKWLWEKYPAYARVWTVGQLADAFENGFEGTAPDGTPYSAYQKAGMKLYRETHCITDMYGLADAYTEEGQQILKIDGANAGIHFAHRTIKIDIDDTLYYNKGEVSFSAADFLARQDAYFSDAANQDQYRVYDIGRKSFVKEMRELKKSWQTVVKTKPWQRSQTLCGEVTAADLAQFCLQFGRGLEDFLEDSGFVFEIKSNASRYLSSGGLSWKKYVMNLSSDGKTKNTKVQNPKSDRFLYAYYDAGRGVYYSNLYGDSFENSGDLRGYLKSITELYVQSGMVCVVGVDLDKVTAKDAGSPLGMMYQKHQSTMNRYRSLLQEEERDLTLLGIGAVLILVGFVMWVTSMIRRRKDASSSGKIAGIAERLPVDLAVLLGGIACWLCVTTMSAWYAFCAAKNGSIGFQSWDYEQWMQYFCCLIVLAVVAECSILLLGWRMYGRTLCCHSVCGFLRQGVQAAKQNAKLAREMFRSSKAPVRYGILMGIFLAVCIAGGLMYLEVSAGMIGMDGILCVACLAALLLMGESVLAMGLRNAMAEEKICQGAKRIARGEISYQLSLSEKAGREQKELVETINHIREGLETAVEESTRSERMKSELITNVSHDIKTPLTSIINYVDLLKREDFDNARAREYLTVLEQKAFRLKGLIEDLIEASKASSGAIELQITRLNFVELVSQTEGEFAERLADVGLSLMTDLPTEAVYFQGDGRRVYRILENLYANVVKYAMPGTRVYTSLHVTQGEDKEADRAVFSIKNISRDPLNMSPQELTERFVRGDEARATEGSGLGLYIASNLTERMDGTFEINMDADLFRVTVTFPTEAADV